MAILEASSKQEVEVKDSQPLEEVSGDAGEGVSRYLKVQNRAVGSGRCWGRDSSHRAGLNALLQRPRVCGMGLIYFPCRLAGSGVPSPDSLSGVLCYPNSKGWGGVPSLADGALSPGRRSWNPRPSSHACPRT